MKIKLKRVSQFSIGLGHNEHPRNAGFCHYSYITSIITILKSGNN